VFIGGVKKEGGGGYTKERLTTSGGTASFPCNGSRRKKAKKFPKPRNEKKKCQRSWKKREALPELASEKEFCHIWVFYRGDREGCITGEEWTPPGRRKGVATYSGEEGRMDFRKEKKIFQRGKEVRLFGRGGKLLHQEQGTEKKAHVPLHWFRNAPKRGVKRGGGRMQGSSAEKNHANTRISGIIAKRRTTIHLGRFQSGEFGPFCRKRKRGRGRLRSQQKKKKRCTSRQHYQNSALLRKYIRPLKSLSSYEVRKLITGTFNRTTTRL